MWSCRAISSPRDPPPPTGVPHITGSPSRHFRPRFFALFLLKLNTLRRGTKKEKKITSRLIVQIFLASHSSLQDAHLFSNYISDASGFPIWRLSKHLLRRLRSEKCGRKFHCFASALREHYTVLRCTLAHNTFLTLHACLAHVYFFLSFSLAKSDMYVFSGQCTCKIGLSL